MKPIAIVLVLVLVAVMAYPANASDPTDSSDAPLFSFSGFGTLGVVHSSEDRADATSNILQPNGAGYTHRWSPEVDSRIAGQVTANFTGQLSAVVQVISEQRYDNTYSPQVEWANIRYQLAPEASVRVGRTVVPNFLVSDYRKVGYANPWVRPPVEVYGLVPIANADGVDASYRVHIGSLTHTFSGFYGRNRIKLPESGSAQSRQQWIVSDTVEFGSLTARLSYNQARLTVDSLNALFDPFRQFGPQGIALADRYDAHDKPLEFVGLAAQYDPGKWFAMAEWGTIQFNSILGRRTAWYASGGYRWPKLSPYVTYARVKGDGNTSDPGLAVSGLPPPLAAYAAGLNAGLDAILAAVPVQETVSLGVRWDLMKNIDLKLQYDHTDLGAGSPGTLTNLQPDFVPGGTVHLISVAIDFVL